MVVAVQQLSSECTATFTVYIVLHRPLPCAVKKRVQITGGTDTKTVPASKTKG